MSSLSCITRSEASRLAAAALCALLTACGGTKAPDPEPEQASAAPETPDKRAGTLSFHYSNKSTDANMALDLGVEDVYLDMTGKPAPVEETQAPAPRRRAPARQDLDDSPLPDRTAPSPSPMTAPPRPGPDASAPAPAPMGAAPAPGAPQRPDPRDKDARQPLNLPDDEEPGYAPDVTDKVLSGIRKAQEFFYQKRYTEALDMVRSSLDARPTAEGHALAGSINYMLGQPGLAKRHWQEALRLNPDMPAVVNMLEKIRTPGGRGSPFPRPIVQKRAAPQATGDVMQAARAPAGQAPYPEEYGPEGSSPTPAPAPAPAAAPDTAKGGKK